MVTNFIYGDELGNIKSVKYAPSNETSIQTLLKSPTAKLNSVQLLSLEPAPQEALTSPLITAAYANGSTSAFHITDAGASVPITWQENRLRPGQRFVGLSLRQSNVYTCTSNGALRKSTIGTSADSLSFATGLLPMRLHSWRLSHDATTFSYGGEEIDLSVHDTERTFAPEDAQTVPVSGKRKRKGEYLTGEVWRARNVPPNNLGIRQPVRITALAYVNPQSSTSSQVIATGNEFGDLRIYDTRAARRPVSNFNSVGKVGAIKVIERGTNENHIFVADSGNSLSCVDSRTGRTAYVYRGISGSVNSVAISGQTLAITASDRLFRIASAFPVSEPGKQQDKRGEILEKHFTIAIPTAVAWNETTLAKDKNIDTDNDDNDDDENIWNGMENVEGSDTEHVPKKRR